MGKYILMGAWLFNLVLAATLITIAVIIHSNELVGIAIVWGFCVSISIFVVGLTTGIYRD